MLRVDNTKTTAHHGAGPWGQINTTHRRDSTKMHFHVYAYLPILPSQKGWFERLIRAGRGGLEIARRA